jgi:hypothetical protein
MTKRSLIILAFSLCLLFRAKAQTNCPYYPLTPGSSITYSVSAITAGFNPATYQLGISTLIPSGPVQTLTCSSASDPMCDVEPLFVEHYNPGIAQNPLPTVPANFDGCLVEGEFAPMGWWYVGEYSNYNQNICLPAECKIPVNPTGGEHLDMVSTIAGHGDTVGTSHWIYQTIGHYPQWNQFQDCWWTCLIEYSTDGSIQQVYNYIFSRGIGMVEFWYVVFPVNYLGSGYFFSAVSYQGQ